MPFSFAESREIMAIHFVYKLDFVQIGLRSELSIAEHVSQVVWISFLGQL